VFENWTLPGRRLAMLRLSLYLLLFVVCVPSPARAELPTKPEGVLPYLEAVYKKGDIDGYANLLAADYTFVLEDMNASWDAATDIKGTRQLFEAAAVELTFGDVAPKPGSVPGTWIIKEVVGVLQVTQNKDGKVFRIENTFSVLIRNERGTLRIAEWKQHSGE
jgi:hypothetical protein